MDEPVTRQDSGTASPGSALPGLPLSPMPTPGPTMPMRLGPPAPRLPPRIGPYTILKILGEGGMGVVYAAYDAELDRKVAIKLLHLRPNAVVGGSDGTKRLLREAQAMAKISHPNVLQVFEAGTHEDRVYLVLEYVEGPTLRVWWKQRARSWQEVVQVFLQVGEGLQAAHEAGIIHRDLKPDNILIDAHGRARVMDFGLARSTGVHEHPIDEDQTTPSSSSSLDLALTIPGSVMGTPAYMPPEQLAGRPVDARCDQFSFCVSMWEALHGTRPFLGQDLQALADDIVYGRPRAPQRPRSPAWLRGVLSRGMAPAPEDRHASLAALLVALRADPRARLRRAVLAVLAALFVAAGVYGYVLAAAADAEACEGGADRFAEIRGRMPAVAAAFAITARPHAQTTAEHVRLGLERYEADWVAMYRDACTASRRGEQSGELLDRRMACLEQRRGEARALVDLFAVADGEIVDRAVAALQGLAPVDACGDAEALAARVAPPADPAVRAAVDEVQRELAGHVVALRAGRTRATLDASEPLVARAEALAYPPALADVLLLRGKLLRLLERGDEAEAALFRALWLAEAHHHDEAAAEAWVELVRVAGEVQGRRTASLRWAEGADAALVRIGDPPLLRARLLNNRGAVALAAMQLTEAQDLFLRSLSLRSANIVEEDVEVANTLNNLGNTLAKMQRKDEAREVHLRALALRERLLGPTHPDVAASCLNLGVILEPEEALRSYARADEILVGSFGPDEPRRATIMVNVANQHIHRGDRAAARKLLESAMDLLTRTGPADSPTLIVVRTNLGMLSAIDGEFAAAEVLLAAELARREAGDAALDTRTAEIRQNLASMRAYQGDYPGAEALLRRNIELLTDARAETSHTVLGSRLSLAQILVRMRRPAEAVPVLREVRSVCDSLTDLTGTGCLNLPITEAEVALAQRDLAAARRALAHHVVDAVPPGDTPDPIERAEQDIVRGQILRESGADRVEGRRLVAEGLETLERYPQYAPDRVAEVRAWLAAHK